MTIVIWVCPEMWCAVLVTKARNYVQLSLAWFQDVCAEEETMITQGF